MAVPGLLMALAIGLSLGLLGGGGSTLTVPVLHYAFGLPTHDAIATSLIVVGVTSAAASVPHARAGVVQWRLGLVFGAASMTTAFVGGRIGALLPGGSLMIAFALVMAAAGTAMLLRARRANDVAMTAGAGARNLPRMAGIGLAVGLLTGILGAGGGFLIVPALTIVGRLPIREAVGTSLFIIVLNSLAGAAGAASHATIHVPTALAVTAIAIAGSIGGARVARRLSGTTLQRAFGFFVIAIAMFMLAHELI